MIELSNISKYLKGTKVLDNISFKFETGKSYSIIGSSGSGKSTFLKCIAGLETLERGTITYRGTSKKEIGFIFQNFNLFNNMTVLENIIYAPQVVLNMNKQLILDEARNLLQKVNLDLSIQDKYPSDISGGQKQRVAIVRTLCMKPKIILYDEPTSALDVENTIEVLKIIHNISRSKKVLSIIVTHQIEFAKTISDLILFFDNGKIIETNCTKNFFTRPQSNRLKVFLSKLITSNKY